MCYVGVLVMVDVVVYGIVVVVLEVDEVTDVVVVFGGVVVALRDVVVVEGVVVIVGVVVLLVGVVVASDVVVLGVVVVVLGEQLSCSKATSTCDYGESGDETGYLVVTGRPPTPLSPRNSDSKAEVLAIMQAGPGWTLNK